MRVNLRYTKMHSCGNAIVKSCTLGGVTKRQPTPDLGQRIERAIVYAGLNKHSAARQLGRAYTTVLAWVNGTSAPDGTNLAQLAELTKVDGDWLLTGRGNMARTGSGSPDDPITDEPEAVDAYLASALGEDLSDDVAKRLRATQFRVLGLTSPSIREVHTVREFIESRIATRASFPDGERHRKRST